ncbi:hypothetical protein [Kitasatospora sp. NPDC094016]|uniref:hypothetical protein n=1 Tax=Kitasatospora sp. NPDC094016 TaxID=3154986 RepID=UPI00331DD201
MQLRPPVIVVSSRIDADATLIIEGDQPLVVIRPAQTFDSAVLAVQAALRADFPHLHPDQIRAMVRTQLPDLPTMDRLMGVGESPPPVDRRAPARSDREIVPRVPRRRRSVAVGQILLAAVIAAVGVGVGYAVGQHTSRPAVVLDRAPNPTSTLSAFAGDPAFRQFAAAGQMRCTSLGPLQARCTDVDQLVMYSEAAVSPNSVAYTFSYGTERIYMMAFHSNADAAAWAQESGSQKTLDNLSVVSRFALWGSDAARLQEYQGLIVEAARNQTRPVTAGLTVKMPDRLAALAFGTLGVASSRLDPLASTPNAPGLFAAVHLVLGGETEPPASARVTASADGSLVTTMLGVDQAVSPPARPVPPPPPAKPSDAPNPAGGAKSPEPPPEAPRPSPKPSTGTLSPSATPSPTPPAESGQPLPPGAEAPAGLPVPADHTDPAGTSKPVDDAPPPDEVSETPVESLLLTGPPTGRPPSTAPSGDDFLEGRRRALRPVR